MPRTIITVNAIGNPSGTADTVSDRAKRSASPDGISLITASVKTITATTPITLIIKLISLLTFSSSGLFDFS